MNERFLKNFNSNNTGKSHGFDIFILKTLRISWTVFLGTNALAYIVFYTLMTRDFFNTLPSKQVQQ
jgi:hypothetical protein